MLPPSKHLTPLSCLAEPQDQAWWQLRHEDILRSQQITHQTFDILFLGDSITHAWETEGDDAFQAHFAHMRTANLGFAGDRTEHVLWRLQNGEIDQLSAHYVVLLIGTNNAGHRHDSPQDIAAGIQAILCLLKAKLPACKIILNAIFARSRHPKKRMRIAVDNTNTIIKSFADNKKVFWLDMNPQLLDAQQVLHESVMPDLLHPNAQQYDLWAKTIGNYINHQ